MISWTQDLREWHESVIAKYPEPIQRELREAMTKWLAGVKDQGSFGPPIEGYPGTEINA